MACILQGLAQAVSAAGLVERFTLHAQDPMVIVAPDELRLQGQLTRQGVNGLRLHQTLHSLLPEIAMLRIAKALYLRRPRLVKAALLLHTHRYTHHAVRSRSGWWLIRLGTLCLAHTTAVLLGVRRGSSVVIVIMDGQNLARRKFGPDLRNYGLTMGQLLR